MAGYNNRETLNDGRVPHRERNEWAEQAPTHADLTAKLKGLFEGMQIPQDNSFAQAMKLIQARQGEYRTNPEVSLPVPAFAIDISLHLAYLEEELSNYGMSLKEFSQGVEVTDPVSTVRSLYAKLSRMEKRLDGQIEPKTSAYEHKPISKEARNRLALLLTVLLLILAACASDNEPAANNTIVNATPTAEVIPTETVNPLDQYDEPPNPEAEAFDLKTHLVELGVVGEDAKLETLGWEKDGEMQYVQKIRVAQVMWNGNLVDVYQVEGYEEYVAIVYVSPPIDSASGEKFITIGLKEGEYFIVSEDGQYLIVNAAGDVVRIYDQNSRAFVDVVEEGAQEEMTEEAEEAPAPVEPNFASAIAEARNQYPEFTPAFDNLENYPYTLAARVYKGEGQFSTFNLKSEAEISFQEQNGTLSFTAKSENGLEATFEWVPLSVQGSNVEGLWGQVQFNTGALKMVLGSASHRFEVLNEERFGGNRTSSFGQDGDTFRDIMGVTLEPSINNNDPTRDPYLKLVSPDHEGGVEWHTRMINGLKDFRIDGAVEPQLREEYIIFDGPEDPRLDIESITNKTVFNLFANVAWGTSAASNEQIAAVGSHYNGTATPEQIEMINNAPNLARRGSGDLAVVVPGGIWHLSPDKPVILTSEALPYPGEPLVQSDTKRYPFSTPAAINASDLNGEQLIIRMVGFNNDWNYYITTLAVISPNLGIPPYASLPAVGDQGGVELMYLWHSVGHQQFMKDDDGTAYLAEAFTTHYIRE